jgi:3-keto-disaccharide hydrolase
MKTPVVRILQHHEWRIMVKLTISLLAVVLLGLGALVACNDKDKDEQQSNASKAVAGQQTAAQKPEEKPDADEGEEGEEGPATPAAVAAEKPAPQQTLGKQLIYNFDSDSVGQLPARFHSARTGQGSESTWAVMADPTAPSKPNVVAQTSTDKTDYRFPLLIADEGSFRDVDLTVKFKAISGSVDQAGGLVFRLKDPNNYYIVRANALEDNYRLYHVVDGRRRQFAGVNFKVTPGVWHELRVEAVGNKFSCYYDGAKKIDATDDTFKDAGKVGLWTKADSVTHFDDLKVTAK